MSAPSSNYDDYNASLKIGAGNGGPVQNGQTPQPEGAPNKVAPSSPAPAAQPQPHLVSQSQT